MKSPHLDRAGSGGAATAILSREAQTFVMNLQVAASDRDARERMSAALQTATLSDGRGSRRPDPQREWGDFERLRAAERALSAVNEMLGIPHPQQPEPEESTLPSEPVQTSATAARPIARFFADGEGYKPDPRKAAMGVWGRARKGVI